MILFTSGVGGLLVDWISGRRIGAVLDLVELAFYLAGTSSLPCGLPGQFVWGNSPVSCTPSLVLFV